MASLMENLEEVLSRESDLYETLLELSRRKTSIIVKGDLEALNAITEEEQKVVSQINHIDKDREARMTEIAKVLNTDVKTLKLTDLLKVLERRPAERQKLALVYDKLKEVVHECKRVNERNGVLVRDALEVTQFEMNILQAAKSAPETANYTMDAMSDGSTMGISRSRFDAKQ